MVGQHVVEAPGGTPTQDLGGQQVERVDVDDAVATGVGTTTQEVGRRPPRHGNGQPQPDPIPPY